MKRKELIDEVAKRAEVSKTDAAKYLNAVLGAIADNLTEGDNEIAFKASDNIGIYSRKHS